MKTKFSYLRDGLVLISLSAFLTLFISQHVFAQDTLTRPGDKKQAVRIKMVTRDGGKVTVMDTTFKGNYSDMDLEKYLKDYEARMKDFEKGMNDFEKGMKEMEIRLQNIPLPDSGMMDSLGNMAEAFQFNWNGKDHPRMHGNRRLNDFSYSFEMPDIPDLPDLPEIPDFNMNPESPNPPMPPDMNFNGKNQSSLSDILGNIPMENVKSYSIKDVKGGKKIVIELKDTPMLRPERQNVIILRDRPGRAIPHSRPHMRNYQKRVIIHQNKPGSQGEDPAPEVR